MKLGRTLIALALLMLTARPSFAAYELPRGLDSLLVVVDPGDTPRETAQLGASAAIQLEHFARRTRWMNSAAVRPRDVAASDAVVYFAEPFKPFPAAMRSALRRARRLVLIDGHLEEIKAAGLGFAHVTLAAREKAAGAEIVYGGQRFGYPLATLRRYSARAPAQTFGAIRTRAGTIPFAVRDGTATFIDAPLSFAHAVADPYADGYAIAAADVVSAALGGARISPPVAMLRLEDVSARVPTERLREIVEFLAARGVAYGIGVIPEEQSKGVRVPTLSQDPGLVDVLRWAQDHGARIILHGLHHSFNAPEDFEFWDAKHSRPLPQDSVAWMRAKVDRGLGIERGLGLRPVMWESPHYSASPLDYQVVGSYFTASWERRQPLAFMPWLIDRDAYGQILLPENLGYELAGYDADASLARQLGFAKAMRVCRDCVAAGFLHPSTVPLADFIDYVDGIREMGYRFADPLELVAARRAGMPKKSQRAGAQRNAGRCAGVVNRYWICSRTESGTNDRVDGGSPASRNGRVGHRRVDRRVAQARRRVGRCR